MNTQKLRESITNYKELAAKERANPYQLAIWMAVIETLEQVLNASEEK